MKSREEAPQSHRTFAVLFGIVGAMALSKFLNPDEYIIGPGTIAAALLGIIWPVFALVRAKWNRNRRSSTQLLFIVAVIASIASCAGAIIALLHAVRHGFIIDLPAEPVVSRRGKWLITLFPAIACLLTLLAAWRAGKDVNITRRHLSSFDAGR